jgi:FKBP-type peptidyl-prolyl cis-trans isomerase FklB
MKLTHAFIAFGLSTVAVLAQSPSQKIPLLQPQPPATATNAAPVDPHKVGYAIGMMQANNMKRQELDIDYDAMLDGMRDAFHNGTPRMTEQEARDVVTQWQRERQSSMMKKREEAKLKNKADGEAFLKKNANEPGVKVLPSGLQYKVLKEGTGPQPKAGDTVSTLYKGTFINGKEFDSTANRGNQPFKFIVGQGQVIKGWDEAVQLMKVGSKWQIFVPSDLAYGENGRGSIGPNETLIFEMEVTDVQPAPKPAAGEGGNQGSQVVSGEIIKVPSAEELKKGAKIEVIHPNQTNK